MGEYTILMKNATKELVATNKIRLCQHESLVDKLVYLVDFDYFGTDLRDFVCTLYWVDPSRVVHMDVLDKDEEIYKEHFLKYFLPATSPLNKFAGDIEMKLVFTKVDYETEKKYKLETVPVVITIDSIADYYSVIPDESFSYVDDKVAELKAIADRIEASALLYEETKADNHMIDENGQLVLMANGQVLEGTAVDVATVEKPDDEDEYEDGVLDITGKYEEVLL